MGPGGQNLGGICPGGIEPGRPNPGGIDLGGPYPGNPPGPYTTSGPNPCGPGLVGAGGLRPGVMSTIPCGPEGLNAAGGPGREDHGGGGAVLLLTAAAPYEPLKPGCC